MNKDGINLRMQGAIKFALEEVARIRPSDPVTFVAEKLIEFDKAMDLRERAEKGDPAAIAALSAQDSDFVHKEEEFEIMGLTFEKDSLRDMINDLVVNEVVPDAVAQQLGKDIAGFLMILLRGLNDSSLLAPAVMQITELLLDQEQEHKRFAMLSMAVGAQSHLFSCETLTVAFKIATEWGEAMARYNMGVAISISIVNGQLSYIRDEHRELALDSSLKGAFLPPVCIFDHDWLMANRDEVLGETPSEISRTLFTICKTLNVSEIKELQREFSLLDDEYPDASMAAIESCLDESLSSCMDHSDEIRWLRYQKQDALVGEDE